MKHQAEQVHELQEDDVTSMNDMTEDIVEDFARQLEEVVRIQDENEEDEEEEFGYQQLPQDEDEEMYQQLQSDEEEEDDDIKDPLQIPLSESARLNPETSDLIKSIMANIQLSNVPEWANNIPESAWLPHVKDKTQ
ncbi:uncharacterized protein EV154DRAFT_221491 [Mucor mucedo]|uniref:uncharacterized protein n=1 Tax=Mucor mucedo TaxID=29922 RepID=UPI002220B7E4|nr:uncharacterized protein EV154DRAFT_221491 [Mucor mucedo]KAI7891562.1 hypothetical protein EV154DRAFT_221491 [Mucor mucedo]